MTDRFYIPFQQWNDNISKGTCMQSDLNIHIGRMVNEAAKNEFWTWNTKLVREIERGRYWIDCNWFPDLVHIIRNYISLKEREYYYSDWIGHQMTICNTNWKIWIAETQKRFIDSNNDDCCNHLIYLKCLNAE